MKSSLKFLFESLLMFCLMTNVISNSYSLDISKSKNESSSNQANDLSKEDWKIEINDKDNNDEFKSMQNGDSSDSGYFLLIIGATLVVISLIGTTYFSIKLYKLSKLKKRSSKKRPQN